MRNVTDEDEIAEIEHLITLDRVQWDEYHTEAKDKLNQQALDLVKSVGGDIG